MYVDENGKTHYSVNDNIEDIKERPDDDDTLEPIEPNGDSNGLVLLFLDLLGTIFKA